MSKTAMIFSPHADDTAAFCGATLAKFAAQGWQVLIVRVTNDASDSWGLTREETILRNTDELRKAAEILGVAEIIELDYETDTLSSIPELELREKFVGLIRQYRPYAVFSFDPMGLYENNQDHIRVAAAVDEALWVAAFDKHYPDQIEGGLDPFSVCERWFFGRTLSHPNHAVDVTEFMPQKVQAMAAHHTMVKHMLRQYQMQLETWGKRVAWIDESLNLDHKELVATFLQEGANAVAAEFKLGEGRMGEVFRLERFGDLEDLIQGMGEPIPGAEILISPGLDTPTSPVQEITNLISSYPLPTNLGERISIMGHHHLCAGAFDELLQSTPFRLAYTNLVQGLQPNPEMEVESIFGYDLFCYQCGYWSHEEGRCSTGWQNKLTKDAAVLEYLGIQPGETRKLEDLQRLLAEKITPQKLEFFCSAGEWKCESYLLGICQRGYARLRERFGIE
jgi:LmbE family N-acetylglucosaminyl deacetylase